MRKRVLRIAVKGNSSFQLLISVSFSFEMVEARKETKRRKQYNKEYGPLSKEAFQYKNYLSINKRCVDEVSVLCFSFSFYCFLFVFLFLYLFTCILICLFVSHFLNFIVHVSHIVP